MLDLNPNLSGFVSVMYRNKCNNANNLFQQSNLRTIVTSLNQFKQFDSKVDVINYLTVIFIYCNYLLDCYKFFTGFSEQNNHSQSSIDLN